MTVIVTRHHVLHFMVLQPAEQNFWSALGRRQRASHSDATKTYREEAHFVGLLLTAPHILTGPHILVVSVIMALLGYYSKHDRLLLHEHYRL